MAPYRSVDRYRVGDVIRYGYSADTARDGTVTSVRPYNHVKVDTSQTVVPPGWIIGVVTVAESPNHPN